MPPTAEPAVPGCLRPIRQAADAYGVDQMTIRRWIASGLISSYRVGPKLLMVDLDEIRDRAVRRLSAPDGPEAGQ